jgi:hypothetical protein
MGREEIKEKVEDLLTTVKDVVEGHGIEEDDMDDAGGGDPLTLTGCCM